MTKYLLPSILALVATYILSVAVPSKITVGLFVGVLVVEHYVFMRVVTS